MFNKLNLIIVYVKKIEIRAKIKIGIIFFPRNEFEKISELRSLWV